MKHTTNFQTLLVIWDLGVIHGYTRCYTRASTEEWIESFIWSENFFVIYSDESCDTNSFFIGGYYLFEF